ncbi:MAG: extracellular solute-binding protein, partial [Anaerolineales bacterium]|nr:extracellular solute-binding protein [Anaerolineales bacterium]
MAYQLGIDVSRYQENVDWNRARAAEVKFVFIRALNGNFADSAFPGHWSGAKAAGLLRGVYLYYREGSGFDPKTQARKLHELISNTGDMGELPPALDIEELNNPSLSASKIKLCLEELERLFGRKPMVYTRATVWDPKVGNVTWASQYPLWVAHYTVAGWSEAHMQRILATQPKLPRPWNRWDVWQISDKAPASNYGVSGNTVDLDFAEEETLERLSGKSVPGGATPPGGQIAPPPTPGGGGTSGGGTPPPSGDPFDTFMMHAGLEAELYSPEKYLVPVDDILAETGVLDVMPQDLKDLLKIRGNTYTVPLNIHRGNVMWTNTRVLEQAGVAVPTNFDEFFAACDALKAKGIVPMAQGSTDGFEFGHLFEVVLAGTVGAEKNHGLWHGTVPWSDPDVTQALENYNKVMDCT